MPDRRLADLESANVRDCELIYDGVRRVKAARRRIANRKAELERLYVEVLGEGWRET